MFEEVVVKLFYRSMVPFRDLCCVTETLVTFIKVSTEQPILFPFMFKDNIITAFYSQDLFIYVYITISNF